MGVGLRVAGAVLATTHVLLLVCHRPGAFAWAFTVVPPSTTTLGPSRRQCPPGRPRRLHLGGIGYRRRSSPHRSPSCPPGLVPAAAPLSTTELGVKVRVRDFTAGDFEDVRSLLLKASSTGLPSGADPEGSLGVDFDDARSVSESYNRDDGSCMLVAVDDDAPRKVLGTAAMVVGTEIPNLRTGTSPGSASGGSGEIVSGVVRRVCTVHTGVPPAGVQGTILRSLMAEIERRADRAGAGQLAVLAYPPSCPCRLDAALLRGAGYRELPAQMGGVGGNVKRFAKFFDRNSGDTSNEALTRVSTGLFGRTTGGTGSNDRDEAPTRGSTGLFGRTQGATSTDGRDEAPTKGSTSLFGFGRTKGATSSNARDEAPTKGSTGLFGRTTAATSRNVRDEAPIKVSPSIFGRTRGATSSNVRDEAPKNVSPNIFGRTRGATSSNVREEAAMKVSPGFPVGTNGATRSSDGMKSATNGRGTGRTEGATKGSGTKKSTNGSGAANVAKIAGGTLLGIPALLLAGIGVGNFLRTELGDDVTEIRNKLKKTPEDELMEREWQLQRTAERSLERLKRDEERQRANLERLKQDLRRLKEGGQIQRTDPDGRGTAGERTGYDTPSSKTLTEDAPPRKDEQLQRTGTPRQATFPASVAPAPPVPVPAPAPPAPAPVAAAPPVPVPAPAPPAPAPVVPAPPVPAPAPAPPAPAPVAPAPPVPVPVPPAPAPVAPAPTPATPPPAPAPVPAPPAPVPPAPPSN